MIAGRVLSESARCVDCRLSLLNAFMSASGLCIRPSAIVRSFRPQLANHTWNRGLIQTKSHYSAVSRDLPGAKVDQLTEKHDTQEDLQNLEPKGDPQNTDSTPWYLQVNPPERRSETLLQRQKLPDLPPDPPPLLQPMLEHVFTDLGLDDLVLLDLRNLDPPPALGANLLMVIGTARSEKHLHVSADKFCRWMKTTHQIAPFADGLLGRGELKLKLKRKARRARILSRVGSAETQNTDDGIRTGWICVTVDNIKDGRPLQNIRTALDDYVGFGGEESGAKVVIQMLTQEKREELDLEDLWGKTIRRHERKQDRISRDLEDVDPQHEVGPSPLLDEVQRPDIPSTPSSSLQSPPHPIQTQIRRSHNRAYPGVKWFSTDIRFQDGAVEFHHPEPSTVARRETVEEPSEMLQEEAPDSTEVIQEDVPEVIERSFADEFLTSLPFHDKRRLGEDGQNLRDSSRVQAHIDFARSLPPEDVRSILDLDPPQTTASPFLRSFRDSLPAEPTANDWEQRLSLIQLGREVGARGYDKRELVRVYRQMLCSLIEVPANLYRLTLITLLRPSIPSMPGINLHIFTTTLRVASNILNDMRIRGHDIVSVFHHDFEFREILEMAVIRAQAGSLAPKVHEEVLRSVQRLLYKIYPEPPPVELELRKLHLCALLGNVQCMWDIWHSFAADMRPRPQELYVAMFQAIAALGHQTNNMYALGSLVPEMDKEEPPVTMDREVAEAVKRCIYVVDSKVEAEALASYDEHAGLGSMGTMGELQRLWWRCERVIQEEGRWAREYDDD